MIAACTAADVGLALIFILILVVLVINYDWDPFDDDF